jgi:TPR repeat protein
MTTGFYASSQIFKFLRPLVFVLCIVCTCAKHPAFAKEADIDRLRSAAELGSVDSEMALGNMYFKGSGVDQDNARAAYWYEKAANAGNPVAEQQIGYFYETGTGVTKDEARAVHWYRLASANGNTDAKVNLAMSYLWGMGTARDQATAMRLLNEAAQSHNASAMTDLGDIYFNGVGMERDVKAGTEWFERAAKLHDCLAEFRLGIILSSPAMQSIELHRALMLLQHSANDGFVPAMHAFGLLLVNHPELSSSHDEAITALNEAANAGMWRSNVVLGILARKGQWVPQDPANAYFRFRAAAMQGGAVAESLVRSDIDELSMTLGPGQVALIDQQASAWATKHSVVFDRIYKSNGSWKNRAGYGRLQPGSDEHAGVLVPNSPY